MLAFLSVAHLPLCLAKSPYGNLVIKFAICFGDGRRLVRCSYSLYLRCDVVACCTVCKLMAGEKSETMRMKNNQQNLNRKPETENAN